MASFSEPLLFAALWVCFSPLPARADTLQITSTPSGATVEINGVVVGTTPYQNEVPGGYFHRTVTALGKRLEYAMVARISLAGYATKELQLTEGPKEWVSLKGHKHGEYWLLRNKQFHVELDRLSEVFTGDLATSSSPDTPSAMDFEPELSSEDVVARAKPAVVQLKGVNKSGSGFFVTQKGIVATNAHLARGEDALHVVLSDGRKLEGKVVDIEERLDIALVKVEIDDSPALPLETVGNVRQGESVIAIGNPGAAMPFSITKGIVSAIGKFSNAGPGTWIQTDAVINPGNSGGPLLNMRGQVIGITAQRLLTKNGGGLTFALSASDLLQVLRKFYPPPESSGPNSPH